MKVGMLEATQTFTLEAKKLEIWFLKQKLDEVDDTVKFYSDVFRALERENIDLKVKLEEQNQLKKEHHDLLYTMKNKLVKIQIKELQAKVSELENKRKIQDNEISQSLIDENKQWGLLAIAVPEWREDEPSIAAMDRCSGFCYSGAPFIIVVMISSWGSRTNLLKKVDMLEATHKGKKCNRGTTTNFKTFGFLRSVIAEVKGRFRGTLSGFGSVAVLRREGMLDFVKRLVDCSIFFRSCLKLLPNWTDTEEEGEPTVQQGTEPSIQEEVEPSAQENIEEDIDTNSICSDQSIDYGSDVHEELRIVKEDVRKFKESRRRKKKEKAKGFLGEVGLDEGYEDIERGKNNFKGKLTGDEPYYDSYDCDSFQSDEEEPVSDAELEGGSLRGRKNNNRVIYYSTL
uniref:Gag-pol polyprotein n=1 Tax=Solanum tuberosum TaxID=4113 RepID=M1DQF3_SOLTU